MCNFLSNKKPIPAAPSFSSLERLTHPIDNICLGAVAKIPILAAQLLPPSLSFPPYPAKTRPNFWQERSFESHWWRRKEKHVCWASCLWFFIKRDRDEDSDYKLKGPVQHLNSRRPVERKLSPKLQARIVPTPLQLKMRGRRGWVFQSQILIITIHHLLAMKLSMNIRPRSLFSDRFNWKNDVLNGLEFYGQKDWKSVE